MLRESKVVKIFEGTKGGNKSAYQGSHIRLINDWIGLRFSCVLYVMRWWNFQWMEFLVCWHFLRAGLLEYFYSAKSRFEVMSWTVFGWRSGGRDFK